MESEAARNMNPIDLAKMELLNNFLGLETKSKEAIKSLIQKEYNSQRIGVEFTGWKDCGDEAKADVIIFTTHDSPHESLNDFIMGELPYGQATIGEAGDYNSKREVFFKPANHLKPFVFIRMVDASEGFKISPLKALKLTALHEFGHLLGLRHEHARDEAKNDPNCSTTETYKTKYSESLDKSTAFYGVYDPNSIMNYCHLRMLKKKVGLKFTVKNNFSITDFFNVTPFYPAKAVNFVDPMLVSKSEFKMLGETFTDYSIKIGISKGDLHSLRCMYHFYDQSVEQQTCRASFNPLK